MGTLEVSSFPFSTSSEKTNKHTHLQSLRTLKFFYYKSLYNEVPDTAMQLYRWSYISIYYLYIDIQFLLIPK